MKTWLIISGIVLGTGTLVFFGVNSYENSNSCEITFTPTLQCKLIEISNTTGPNETGLQFDDMRLSKPLKPLILLYPQSDTPVDVSLEYSPGFSATYPEYNTTKQGWSVLAHPDGTLIDHGTNQDTYGLFWEGNPQSNNYDLSHGFVIKGSELRNFLYTKLTEIGLNTKEKSDFIMYWYPKLQEYPYIQITFAGTDYTNTAKLNISPTPDSLLRVFMVAKPLIEYTVIPEQKLQKFQRKGFSVVEWGGTIIE